MQNLGCIP